MESFIFCAVCLLLILLDQLWLNDEKEHLLAVV